MADQIKFVKRRTGSLPGVIYQGYGQRLTFIGEPGERPIGMVAPIDQLRGVGITSSAINSPCSKDEEPMDFFSLRFDVSGKDIETVCQNFRDAKAFCEEYRRRKTELLKEAGFMTE